MRKEKSPKKEMANLFNKFFGVMNKAKWYHIVYLVMQTSFGIYNGINVTPFCLISIPLHYISVYLYLDGAFESYFKDFKNDSLIVENHLETDFPLFKEYFKYVTGFVVSGILLYNFFPANVPEKFRVFCFVLLVYNLLINFTIRVYIAYFKNTPLRFASLYTVRIGVGSAFTLYTGSINFWHNSSPDDYPSLHHAVHICDPLFGRGFFYEHAVTARFSTALKGEFKNTGLYNPETFVEQNTFNEELFYGYIYQHQEELYHKTWHPCNKALFPSWITGEKPDLTEGAVLDSTKKVVGYLTKDESGRYLLKQLKPQL